jgi:predicted membrane chloride channel (bestrophin family)
MIRPALIDEILGDMCDGAGTDLNPVSLAAYLRTQDVYKIDSYPRLASVLWLALAERGHIISRQDAIDAWELAALTPRKKTIAAPPPPPPML